MKSFFHKISHWEYWPYQLVYAPIFLLWPYFALKARSLFFFSAANPKMKNGGFYMISKKKIYDLIPKQYYPKTLLIHPNDSLDSIKEKIFESNLNYPLFLKPDIGLRGMAVKKIFSEEEFKRYHHNIGVDYLIQEPIPYPMEAGIFYVRYPDELKGKITGIVSKKSLSVVGNGTSTVEELIKTNPRFRLQLKSLKQQYGNRLQKSLELDETWNLVPYGTHCRGALFEDGSSHITEKLTTLIDGICKQIDGFYYGRFDILFENWKTLENGENFSIVELNGAMSEPAHIYDPKHSLTFAWKELIRHYNYMSDISRSNNLRGIEHQNLKDGIQNFKQHFIYCDQLSTK